MASTIIADLNCEGKVTCHMLLVEKLKIERKGPWRPALQNQQSWGSLSC